MSSVRGPKDRNSMKATGVKTAALVLTLLLAAGCFEQHSAGPAGAAKAPNTFQMIDYLYRQKLPALVSVGNWRSDYGPGLVLHTPHYEVFTTFMEPLVLARIPGFLESAYNAYQSQLPWPVPTSSAFTVYLFDNRNQWEQFTQTFAGTQAGMYMKIKSGAYYLNGSVVAYNVGRDKTFSVLGHEGWHQFNSRHFKFRLPSWLDEGIATLFETSVYNRGFFYFDPSRNLYRLGPLKQTLADDRMISLQQLIAMNPGEAILASDEKVAAFYAQSYALVRFLREEGYGRRLRNYHQMLLGGFRGDWPLSEAARMIAANRNIPLTVGWNRAVGTLLFERYIGEDWEQLEKEYLAFCRKIVYHVRRKADASTE